MAIAGCAELENKQQKKFAANPGDSSKKLNRLSTSRNQETSALVIIITVLSG